MEAWEICWYRMWVQGLSLLAGGKPQGASFIKRYASFNLVAFYKPNGYESFGSAVLPLNREVMVACKRMRKYLSLNRFCLLILFGQYYVHNPLIAIFPNPTQLV